MTFRTSQPHHPSRPALPTKLATCLVLLFVSGMAAALPQVTVPPALRWTLVPRSCAPIPSSNPPILCGEYGTFYFGPVVTGSCPVIASNPGEVLKSYSKSIVTKPFVPTGHETLPLPLSTEPKGEGNELLEVPGDPIPFTNWVAVIDTAGGHAQSVTFLISELAGPDVGVQILSIDDPAIVQTLGPAPTDFHVIGQVCAVLNQIEGPAPIAPPPSVVNLSIGRRLETGDPADDTSCNPNTAACQLATLLARAKADGSTLVVALGNQRDRMWPANLGSVIGAGQLSARLLLDSGVVTPAWENPPGLARALFAGHSLCLAGWPAPAGSSYSAATASGLIAEARAHVPDFNAYAPGTLAPQRDPVSARWGLARNGVMVGGTNTALTGLYDDLTTGSCWAGANATDATEGAWGPGYAPRSAVPFPTWTSMTFNPAPVEDPCTPCVAADDGSGETMTVNLSQAEPLAAEKHIDAAHLRVGNTFYALNLSEETRVLLRDGALQTLVLPNMWPHVESTTDASIMFSILNVPDSVPPDFPDPDSGHLCPTLPPGSCYWISIPLLPKE
jgi:hypothetical protein